MVSKNRQISCSGLSTNVKKLTAIDHYAFEYLLRLRQQGFETNLLQKSFNKFFFRHSRIVEKYGAALQEMRLAI